ncbi:hypothetical protein [Hominenteromicrobium mulieris]|uniref:hypothetical protein n=1 Tax=Hominenteromicrobium mulieris TaxID=2885357 RepID=UPI0031BB2B74
MPKWEAIMLYCTKCKSICEDSTQTCPNCKRSRGLRPVKPEDEVFFLKVSEGEAAELALLFEQNAVRHAIHPVKGGFSTSVYDPEYLPTDKDIYVEYQDLERAKELMREEQSQEKPSEEDDMPRGKRMLIQSLSVIAFMAIVILVVLGSDFIANLLKALFTK